MTDLELAKELQKRLGLNPKAIWMQKRMIDKTDQLELLIIAYGLNDRLKDVESLLGRGILLDANFIIESEIVKSEAERNFVLLYLEYDIFNTKNMELIDKREKISQLPITQKTGGFMKNITMPTRPSR